MSTLKKVFEFPTFGECLSNFFVFLSGLDDFGTVSLDIEEPPKIVSSPGIPRLAPVSSVAHVRGGFGAKLSAYFRQNKEAIKYFGGFIAFFGCLVLIAFVLIGASVRAPPPINPPVWNSYRLPTFAAPFSYSMNLTMDVETGRTQGYETIRVTFYKKTNFLVLHAASNIRITKALLGVPPQLTPRPGENRNTAYDHVDLRNAKRVVKSQSSRAGNVDEVYMAQFMEYNATLQRYMIQWYELGELTEDIAEVDLLIGLEWVGSLSDDMRGVYRSRYHDTQANKDFTLVSTHFEATDARAAFPCFDEPDKKAIFSISLKSSSTRNVVIGNMPVEEVTPLSDGSSITLFKTTPVMSTYLIAFVVSNFDYVEDKTGRVPVRVYARPEVKTHGDYAANICSKIIASYEDLYQLPYPLPKMDMAAIPDFNAGAMENWGLVTYRETALLYDPKGSSSADKVRVAQVVAHELAHQWFGNIVTMRWWSDVWLNEGFATFVEYYGVDAVHPEWNLWEHFILNDQQRALHADSLASTHPVMKDQDVQTPAQIGSLFGAIIYSKGGSILRMLESYLNSKKADSFKAGLQDYLKSHMFGNAATEDLWASLKKTSGEDVSKLMRGWVLRPGYPVVRVTSTSAGKVHLSQERFMLKSNAQTSADRYIIPIGYNVDGASGFFVMDETQSDMDTTLNVNSNFIINSNRYGFFRVAYESDMIDRLTADVSSTQPRQTPSDVAGLMDDMWYLSQSNVDYHVNVAKLLTFCKTVLTATATRFQTYVPVLKAFDTLITAGERDESNSANVKTVVSKLLTPIFNRIGFDVKEQDAFDTKLLRSVLASLEARFGNPQHYLDLFEAIVRGESVHPDLRVACYRAAMMVQDDTVLERNYNFLLAFYRSTSGSSADRVSALMAMTYCKKEVFLQRLIQASLDENIIRAQETSSVIAGIALRGNRRLAWNFVKLNFDTLSKRYAAHLFTFSSLLTTVTDGFHTTEDLADVMNFLENKSSLTSSELLGISDSISSKIVWMSDHGRSVKDWFATEATTK